MRVSRTGRRSTGWLSTCAGRLRRGVGGGGVVSSDGVGGDAQSVAGLAASTPVVRGRQRGGPAGCAAPGTNHVPGTGSGATVDAALFVAGQRNPGQMSTSTSDRLRSA